MTQFKFTFGLERYCIGLPVMHLIQNMGTDDGVKSWIAGKVVGVDFVTGNDNAEIVKSVYVMTVDDGGCVDVTDPNRLHPYRPWTPDNEDYV